MLKDNIHIDGYVFSGYLIKIDSYSHSGILLATAEMADNPQEFGNEILQSQGVIIHGRENIGKEIAFRYDVIDQGGIEGGQRKYKQRVLVDGKIMWEVKPAQVIGIKQDNDWHSVGRHIVLKQVVRPERQTALGIILPEGIEKDKFEVAWPNKFLPVGARVSVDNRFLANIQVDKEMLFYIPEEYVLFVYNDKQMEDAA